MHSPWAYLYWIITAITITVRIITARIITARISTAGIITARISTAEKVVGVQGLEHAADIEPHGKAVLCHREGREGRQAARALRLGINSACRMEHVEPVTATMLNRHEVHM